MYTNQKYVDALFPHFFIKNGTLVMPDAKRKISIIKVEPINFKLKSRQEQDAVLESYKVFLKKINCDFQILIQSVTTDISVHTKEIEKCISYEEDIRDLAESYMKLIKDIAEVRGSITRKFYIIVKEKDGIESQKVIDGLNLCGNTAKMCDNEEILEILKICF